MAQRYNPDTTGIEGGQPVKPEHLLDNYNFIESAIDEHADELEKLSSVADSLDDNSFVVSFNESLLSTSPNNIIIAGNATVLFDSVTQSRITSFPSQTLSVSPSTSGYLFARYNNVNKDYVASTSFITTYHYLLGTYTVSALGVVSYSKSIAKPWTGQSSSYTVKQTFLAPIEVIGGIIGTNILPYRYAKLGHVLHSNINQITIAPSVHKSSDSSIDIITTGATLVNLTSLGLNGIGETTNLAGTITVAASSTTVVGVGTTFTTTFVVGDVIRTAGGQARRITVITDNTHLTVHAVFASTEGGTTYRQGGLTTNTWYYLYAICKIDATSPSFILSTRNNIFLQDISPILPTTHPKYRQVKFAVFANASGVARGFVHSPNTSEIHYTEISILLAPITTAWQTISAGVAGVPAISRLADILVVVPPVIDNIVDHDISTRTTGVASIRSIARWGGSAVNGAFFGQNSSFVQPLNDLQQFDIINSGTNAVTTVYCTGFQITEDL